MSSHIPMEEQFKEKLLRFSDWVEVKQESYFYYDPDPNFVVCRTDDEPWEVSGGEQWVRAATNPNAFVCRMHLLWNQTLISEIHCIYFDEFRHLTPAPIVTGMISFLSRWYFSLCADDLEFHLLPLFERRTKDEIVRTGQLSSGRKNMPVAIFGSWVEKEKFSEFLLGEPITDEELSSFEYKTFESTVSDTDKKIIIYSRAVLQRLENFRRSRP